MCMQVEQARAGPGQRTNEPRRVAGQVVAMPGPGHDTGYSTLDVCLSDGLYMLIWS